MHGQSMFVPASVERFPPFLWTLAKYPSPLGRAFWTMAVRFCFWHKWFTTALVASWVFHFWQMPQSLHHVGMSYDSLTMGLPSVPEYFRGRNVAMYRVVRRGRTLHLQAGCLPFILRHLAKGISLLFVNFVPPDHRRSVSTVSVHHGPRGYWKDGSRNCRGAFSCGAPTVLRRGVLCTREGLCAS